MKNVNFKKHQSNRRMSAPFAFLSGEKGFSLAEVMVAAGLLGVISMGVMQLTSNIQRSQTRFSQDAEISTKLQQIRIALRSQLGCTRTFAGEDGFQPAVNPTADSFETGVQVTNVYDGRRDGSAEELIVATTSEVDDANLYSMGTGGAFRITDIRIWGADDPDRMNEPVTANVTVVTERQGVQEATLGRLEGHQTFPIEVTLWDAGDPNLNGTPGTIRTCYSNEDSYVQAACNAIGGMIDWNDGLCKNVVFGDSDVIYDPSPLEEESADFELLVDGDTRLRRNLEVGFGGDEPFSGSSVDLPDTGVAFFQSLLYLGYDESFSPPELPTTPGQAAFRDGLYVGYESAIPSQNFPTGSIANLGNMYVGFEHNDDYITGVSSDSGNLMVKNGIMIDRRDEFSGESYGINITNDGANNLPFITVGDGTFLTDPGGENELGVYGQGNSAHATLYLGQNNLQQITGGSGGIGIGNLEPGDIQEQLHVRGDSRFEGNVYVDNGYIYSYELDFNDWGISNDYIVPNIGWVRNRIAQTLAPSQAAKEAIAGDIMADAFDDPDSALRIIRGNVCINTEVLGANGTTRETGQWNGQTCTLVPTYCNTNGQCHNVYANNDVIAGRDIRAGRDVRADRNVIASSNVVAGNNVSAGRDVRADRDIRAGRNLRASNDVRAGNRVCISGAGCYTRFHSRVCSPHNYVVGIRNGWIVCTHD